MTFRSAVPALALLLAPCLPIDAQPRAIVPVVLTLPSGPRTLALGDVGVTSRDDEVIFFNPAQLVIANGFSTSGERYGEGSSGAALSAVTRFNGGGVALGMRTQSAEASFVVQPRDASGIRANAGVLVARVERWNRPSVQGHPVRRRREIRRARRRRVATRARSRRSRGLESIVRFVHRRRRGAEPRAGRRLGSDRSRASAPGDARRFARRLGGRIRSLRHRAPCPGSAATRSRRRADSKSTTVG